MSANRQNQTGFTLVELIIVMVITGIIGGMVAIFITAPVKQYTDTARRAELTDIADTAIQRMLREIRSAVPNSVRLPGGAASASYIEFLPTKVSGRYQLNPSTPATSPPCGAAGNDLAFGVADTCFNVIGPSLAASAVAGDYMVVGSTQSNGATAYKPTSSGGVLFPITTAGQSITMAATTLPAFAQLPSQRFQIVDGTTKAVTDSGEGVGIVGGSGTGQLKRYSGYGFNATQTLPVNTPAILANYISSCTFVYDIVNQRDALVGITLQITEPDESGNPETVSLYEEAHVNNAP